MSRATDEYRFVTNDIDVLLGDLISQYEIITGRTVRPSSPERLFLSWVASAILELNANLNYAANQNIPSRAEGDNLDALGELFFDKGRPEATPATVTVKVHISEAQEENIIIPAGTRFAPSNGSPVFATTEAAQINAGDTTIDLKCECQEDGTVGNGLAAGAVNVLIDVDNILYYDHCESTDESDGGSDRADDDTYYDLLVASEDAYSCAGARGAYEYWAKSVSTDIEDVIVNSPAAAEVRIYALMNDGKKASQEIKGAILEACSDESVRPLTDFVKVEDPEEIEYNIKLTYYIAQDSAQSSQEYEAAVNAAVDEYVAWQSAKLGRDVNPSKLISLIMATGVKRVDVTEPAFKHLEDGKAKPIDASNLAYEKVKPPQLAKLGQRTVTNGGYEDE